MSAHRVGPVGPAPQGLPSSGARSVSPAAGTANHFITWPQAAFIGVGAMVGAGIFSLLGAAGEVAGAAVWVSFVLAGVVAVLQGYSFAHLGARFPSGAGLLEYIAAGFGERHVTGIAAWVTYSVNTIVTAMVAVSFGSYASSLFTGGNAGWARVFAVLVVIVMTGVNIAGSRVVARAQSLIVFIVVGILAFFAVVTILNMNPSLLAPSGYPPVRDIVSSVALTFFAFLGFGIVTFTAKDLADPSKELPRAMYLALGIATVIYVAVALGVFGTLSVEKVVSSGATALAVAAEPTLGHAGYLLMSVTGFFACAGATNGGLYPASGFSKHLSATRQFPPLMGRDLGGRATVGLLIAAAGAIVMALFFSLSAIASIGSAAALLVFMLATVSHLRVRDRTGANVAILVLALASAGVVFLAFVFSTLVNEPASAITLLAILVLSIVLDFGWKARRDAAAPRAIA